MSWNLSSIDVANIMANILCMANIIMANITTAQAL